MMPRPAISDRPTLLVFNADAVAYDLDAVALLAADPFPADATPVDLDRCYAAVVMLAADEPTPDIADAVALDAACPCRTCTRRRSTL